MDDESARLSDDLVVEHTTPSSTTTHVLHDINNVLSINEDIELERLLAKANRHRPNAPDLTADDIHRDSNTPAGTPPRIKTE